MEMKSLRNPTFKVHLIFKKIWLGVSGVIVKNLLIIQTLVIMVKEKRNLKEHP